MSEPILFATDLIKKYRLPNKTVEVLNGASLTITPGERVAIVGRSGIGKSTLLHVLGALDRPESGEVIINGRSIYKLSERARSNLRAREIGFIFQSYHLFPEMDISENVMLPAWAAGAGQNRTHIKTRAAELLELVGLTDRATHTPLELSGGEQQRAAIARALMNQPQLLLADEPTGNLDTETGAQVLELLFSISSQSGRALVIVTHSPTVAARCDRTLTLNNGTLHLTPAASSATTTTNT